MFTHIVLFWLNEGTAARVREGMLADCQSMLRRIPTVRHLSAGTPAMTPRPVVDNSYDVGLCVVYDDSKGHDEYQTHPLHQEFSARHKQHWKRVLVYDFAM